MNARKTHHSDCCDTSFRPSWGYENRRMCFCRDSKNIFPQKVEYMYLCRRNMIACFPLFCKMAKGKSCWQEELLQNFYGLLTTLYCREEKIMASQKEMISKMIQVLKELPEGTHTMDRQETGIFEASRESRLRHLYADGVGRVR